LNCKACLKATDILLRKTQIQLWRDNVRYFSERLTGRTRHYRITVNNIKIKEVRYIALLHNIAFVAIVGFTNKFFSAQLLRKKDFEKIILLLRDTGRTENIFRQVIVIRLLSGSVLASPGITM
jgi:hypothetical protein